MGHRDDVLGKWSAQRDIATISRSATRFAVLRTSCCVGDKVALDVVLSASRWHNSPGGLASLSSAESLVSDPP